MDAARALIDIHQCYASSVHCSYYGSFQFIKSTLNRIGITYELMDNEIATNSKLKSNSLPIQKIYEATKRDIGTNEARNIKNKINDLKALRVESDYHLTMINLDISETALRQSEEIIRLIKQYFK